MESKKPETDPDAPPSEAEARAAAKLRRALEDESVAHDGAEFARALALAHRPREISADENRERVNRAVALAAKGRSTVIRVVFGVTATLAAAAAAIFVIGKMQQEVVPAAQHISRSTQPLFSEHFSKEDPPAARIDRIAMARSSDLRDNRFAQWGVR